MVRLYADTKVPIKPSPLIFIKGVEDFSELRSRLIGVDNFI